MMMAMMMMVMTMKTLASTHAIHVASKEQAMRFKYIQPPNPLQGPIRVRIQSQNVITLETAFRIVKDTRCPVRVCRCMIVTILTTQKRLHQVPH
jgi:hypothetical protein